MMVWKRLARFLKRRTVLVTAFGICLLYCGISLWHEFQFPKLESGNAVVNEEEPVRVAAQPFHWTQAVDEKNTSGSKLNICRNSVQGKILITDDRGFVCLRTDLLASGCCNPESATSKLYSCDTCLSNGCCSVFEYCISCCLHPSKKPLLQGLLNKAAFAFNLLFSSVTDPFELCMAKCRTSSQSVQHENSYRDPKSKFCYGETPPVLHPVGQ